MIDDWRIYRPAIWLVMFGIAVMLLVSPWYLAAVPFGAAIGVGLKIHRRRRARATVAGGRPVSRQRPRDQRRRRSGR